jgi:hypothetical protein
MCEVYSGGMYTKLHGGTGQRIVFLIFSALRTTNDMMQLYPYIAVDRLWGPFPAVGSCNPQRTYTAQHGNFVCSFHSSFFGKERIEVAIIARGEEEILHSRGQEGDKASMVRFPPARNLPSLIRNVSGYLLESRQ